MKSMYAIKAILRRNVPFDTVFPANPITCTFGANLIECEIHHMHLVGADVLHPKTIAGMLEMPAELRDGVDVGLLGRRRKIADRHFLDMRRRRELISAIWKPPG
jgi:hypothetical protein